MRQKGINKQTKSTVYETFFSPNFQISGLKFAKRFVI